MYFRRKPEPDAPILQIIESRRTGSQVRQQVIGDAGTARGTAGERPIGTAVCCRARG
jgi:hypothetical protein